MNPVILIVDDEEVVRNSTGQWLELAGFEVELAADAESAMSLVRNRRPDAVLTDLKMPKQSGLDLMREVHRIDAEIPVLLITAHGDIPAAVQATREGAYDFLQKPYVPEQLSLVVQRAVEQRRLKCELRSLSGRIEAQAGLAARLIGTSPAIVNLRTTVRDLAAHDQSVIIIGETGTGKEVVARALHDFGPRAKGRFVAINCAAIPAELVESELFGHEAGAFTGARGTRIGKFEFAKGGTVLLDEIESMPLATQAKMLRVLQERVVERVGSNESIAIDVRIIAASKTHLEAAARTGGFRLDLYYRLAGVEISLPPLRRREEDVLLLFEYFAAHAAKMLGKDRRPLQPADIEALFAHDWPGNIRELKLVAERHVLQLAASGRTIDEILRRTVLAGEGPRSLADRVAAFERRLIECALRDCGGSIAAVTEALRIPRRTLNEKMLKYGLRRECDAERDAATPT